LRCGLLMVRVKGPSARLEDAFSLMIKEGTDALMVLEVPVTPAHQKRIADLAITHRLPSLFPGGLSRAGGLITFGTTVVNTLPCIPGYVDKILKGTRPGELPITVTTRRELIFNLATAHASGLRISPELLKREDQVVKREFAVGPAKQDSQVVSLKASRRTTCLFTQVEGALGRRQ
jgi:hypothetical protein